MLQIYKSIQFAEMHKICREKDAKPDSERVMFRHMCGKTMIHAVGDVTRCGDNQKIENTQRACYHSLVINAETNSWELHGNGQSTFAKPLFEKIAASRTIRCYKEIYPYKQGTNQRQRFDPLKSNQLDYNP